MGSGTSCLQSERLCIQKLIIFKSVLNKIILLDRKCKPSLCSLVRRVNVNYNGIIHVNLCNKVLVTVVLCFLITLINSNVIIRRSYRSEITDFNKNFSSGSRMEMS